MSLSYEEIKESLDLEAVLDELGVEVTEVSRRGWYNGHCPIPEHGVDTNPSWGINSESFVSNCYKCGSMSLASLVMHLNGCDYEEALDFLAMFSDVESNIDVDFVERIERYLDKAPKSRPTLAREETLPRYRETYLDGLPLASLELLAKWGITSLQTVEHFNLRYDERHDWKGFYTGPALIIPHYFGGRLVGWQARWMADDRPKRVPKYVNTDDFPKQQTLFGYDIPKTICPVVVESALTVVRLYDAGHHAVATFGASVSDIQTRLLTAFPAVILSYDNDSAGQNRQRALGEKLANLMYVMGTVPAGDEKGDLADLSDKEIAQVIDPARCTVYYV